jgi:hypothetical protein
MKAIHKAVLACNEEKGGPVTRSYLAARLPGVPYWLMMRAGVENKSIRVEPMEYHSNWMFSADPIRFPFVEPMRAPRSYFARKLREIAYNHFYYHRKDSEQHWSHFDQIIDVMISKYGVLLEDIAWRMHRQYKKRAKEHAEYEAQLQRWQRRLDSQLEEVSNA